VRNGHNVGFVGLETGRSASTGENHSPAYLAPGLSEEDARTPFDRGSEEDALPVQQPPSCRSVPRRRQTDRVPDLFVKPEDWDYE
jgi:hypothetical protein